VAKNTEAKRRGIKPQEIKNPRQQLKIAIGIAIEIEKTFLTLQSNHTKWIPPCFIAFYRKNSLLNPPINRIYFSKKSLFS
jgi:hypothetical protein